MKNLTEQELIKRIESEDVDLGNMMDLELQFKEEQEKDKKALEEAWF